MLRSLSLFLLFTCMLAGCAHETGKVDLTKLGKQLDGPDQTENAFAGFVNNKFDCWQMSSRIEMPISASPK